MDDFEVVPSYTRAFAPLPTDSTKNATTQCFDWYFTIAGKFSSNKASNY